MAASLAPASAAQGKSDVALRGDINPTDGRTFVLGDSIVATPDVEMDQEVAIVWATEHPLAVGVDLGGQTVDLSLYFARDGFVDARYGWASVDGSFTPFTQAQRFHFDAVPRGTLPLPAGTLDVYHFEGSIAIPEGAIIPTNGRPAIELVPDKANTLYTESSLLGSPEESRATIPLPELNALLLFAAGAGLVGMVYLRRRT